MDHPPPVKPHVLSFCGQVCPGFTPQFVPMRPLLNAPANECFQLVPQEVSDKGGRAKYGWAIWERYGAMIEAEFHCVWQSPSGELVDITPKQGELEGVTEILFLADPRRKYEDRQINNIRKPLLQNFDIKTFIRLADEIFVEMNRGELADYHGPLRLEGRLLRLVQEKQSLGARLMRKWPQVGAPRRLGGAGATG